VGAVVANLRDVTDRREMEQQLRVSLQEKEILVREVHHRVKNNLQIILSLLNLQAETVQAPQVHEIFMVSKQRVKAIAMIHERLYSSGDLSSVGLCDYLKDLVHTIVQANRPDGSIAVQVDIPPIRLSVNTAVPCGLIVNELVTNSIKHAFAKGQKGRLKVEVRSAPENRLALLVEDDGRGLPEHIRLEDAKSLGLTIVRTLAKQLGGTVDVQRAAGARFHVTFANKP
jgi:two-component sensor histidine kinase